jgi:hypothetical protein
VHLYGSWDNFQQPYPLKRDKQKSSGHWTGCHSFNDIYDTSDRPSTPSLNHDPTGLAQGATYFYFYTLDDEEWYDPAAPHTSLCSMMPGQRVNILEVPIERPMSILSMPTMYGAGSEEEVAAAEKAKRRSRMLRLGRKRPISEEESTGEKRRERTRGEWMVKGVKRISNVVGKRLGSRKGEAETKVETEVLAQEHPRRISSALSVLSTDEAALAVSTLDDAVDDTHSLDDSLGTISLTSDTTTQQAVETPQLRQAEFHYEQSPPSLYHSTTSSLQATPASLLITPQHLNIDNDGNAEKRTLPPVRINGDWLNTLQVSAELQDGYLTQPQAFSRHTLGTPFSPLPSQTSDTTPQPIRPAGLAAFHPFFRLGARVSTHAGMQRLSQAGTDVEGGFVGDERAGLELVRQKCDVHNWEGSGMSPRLSAGVGEIDLGEVNRRLMQTEKVFDRDEFGWMSAAIF